MTDLKGGPPASAIASQHVVVDVHGEPTTVRRAGTGRTVLFLHGAFFPTDWLPVHERLAARVDLVAPVHPGYLEGGPPEWMRGFDDLILHYRELLDVLGLERVDIVGYDLGGWLAALLAVYYPQRVRSLTVIAPTGLLVPEAPAMEWLAADPARVVDALFNGEPGQHGAMFPAAADIDGFVRSYGENGVTARLIWERRYDARLARRLTHVRVPAHVITAAEDRVVPAVQARRWAELIPGARLTELADGGHAVLVQQPDVVAGRIVEFIEEVAP